MSNFKYMSMTAINEILDENYTRGKNGKDYEENKEELQEALWEKQQKSDEEEFERMLEEYNEAA